MLQCTFVEDKRGMQPTYTSCSTMVVDRTKEVSREFHCMSRIKITTNLDQRAEEGRRNMHVDSIHGLNGLIQEFEEYLQKQLEQS